MVAQIFLDIINCGAMSLDGVNLIIFDECHRAVTDHPMRQIMQRFEKCPIDKRPRVLGLSATLLNANVNIDKVQETIEVFLYFFDLKEKKNSILKLKKNLLFNFFFLIVFSHWK